MPPERAWFEPVLEPIDATSTGRTGR